MLGSLPEKISLRSIFQSVVITSVYVFSSGVISDHQGLGHAVWCREKQAKTTGILNLLRPPGSYDDYHSDQMGCYGLSLVLCMFVQSAG